jgi:hypothetical protein
VTTRILPVPNGQPFRTESQGVVRMRPHACGRNCPAHDEAGRLRLAAARFLGDAYEVLTGTGAHAGHRQKQKGACVGCSCGLRVQGRLAARG